MNVRRIARCFALDENVCDPMAVVSYLIPSQKYGTSQYRRNHTCYLRRRSDYRWRWGYRRRRGRPILVRDFRIVARRDGGTFGVIAVTVRIYGVNRKRVRGGWLYVGLNERGKGVIAFFEPGVTQVFASLGIPVRDLPAGYAFVRGDGRPK